MRPFGRCRHSPRRPPCRATCISMLPMRRASRGWSSTTQASSTPSMPRCGGCCAATSTASRPRRRPIGRGPSWCKAKAAASWLAATSPSFPTSVSRPTRWPTSTKRWWRRPCWRCGTATCRWWRPSRAPAWAAVWRSRPAVICALPARAAASACRLPSWASRWRRWRSRSWRGWWAKPCCASCCSRPACCRPPRPSSAAC